MKATCLPSINTNNKAQTGIQGEIDILLIKEG